MKTLQRTTRRRHFGAPWRSAALLAVLWCCNEEAAGDCHVGKYRHILPATWSEEDTEDADQGPKWDMPLWLQDSLLRGEWEYRAEDVDPDTRKCPVAEHGPSERSWRSLVTWLKHSEEPELLFEQYGLCPAFKIFKLKESLRAFHDPRFHDAGSSSGGTMLTSLEAAQDDHPDRLAVAKTRDDPDRSGPQRAFGLQFVLPEFKMPHADQVLKAGHSRPIKWELDLARRPVKRKRDPLDRNSKSDYNKAWIFELEVWNPKLAKPQYFSLDPDRMKEQEIALRWKCEEDSTLVLLWEKKVAQFKRRKSTATVDQGRVSPGFGPAATPGTTTASNMLRRLGSGAAAAGTTPPSVAAPATCSASSNPAAPASAATAAPEPQQEANQQQAEQQARAWNDLYKDEPTTYRMELVPIGPEVDDEAAGCEAGEYTSWTGAHTLVLPRNLPPNGVETSGLPLVDATRRFDKRTPRYEYSGTPYALLELENLEVRCESFRFSKERQRVKDEIVARFRRTPKWTLPPTREPSVRGENVYYPWQSLPDLRGQGEGGEAGNPQEVGGPTVIGSAAPGHVKHPEAGVVEIRFARYLEDPDFLEKKLEDFEQRFPAELSAQQLVAEGRVAKEDKHKILVARRQRNLLFDKAEHSYALEDIRRLGVEKRPDKIPLISWSGLQEWFFDKFNAESTERNQRMSSGIDHMAWRKSNEMQAWFNKRREEGTALHKLAEVYYNLLGDPKWRPHIEFLHNENPEWRLGFLVFAREFVQDLWQAEPFATELRMYYRPLYVSGTTDMLFQRTNPGTGALEFIMCDWKRMAVLDNRQYYPAYSEKEKDQFETRWEEYQDKEFERVSKNLFANAPNYGSFASAGGADDAGGSTAGGKRESRLWYRLNLVREAFQAPWMMTRTFKYSLQLLFYKWMAELVYDIEIKYTWIVLLNPIEKLSEKMIFLDRKVGVEVYLVDGWSDFLHARLQQIVQTRHETMLEAGYKFDAADVEPIHPSATRLSDLVRLRDSAPWDGAGSPSSRRVLPALPARQVAKPVFHSQAATDLQKYHTSSLLMRTCEAQDGGCKGSGGADAAASTTSGSGAGAARKTKGKYSLDAPTATPSLAAAFLIDHSDGTIVKIKSMELCRQIFRQGCDFLRPGDRIDTVYARGGEALLQQDFGTTSSSSSTASTTTTTASGSGGRTRVTPKSNAPWISIHPVKRQELVRFPLTRIEEVLIVRDKHQIPREEKTVFDKLREDGFSAAFPTKLQKLKMFVPSFEEVRQKVHGFPKGTKIWDRETKEVGEIVAVQDRLIGGELLATVRFPRFLEGDTADHRPARDAEVAQAELQFPLWFRRYGGRRPRYEVTFEVGAHVRTTFEHAVYDADEEEFVAAAAASSSSCPTSPGFFPTSPSAFPTSPAESTGTPRSGPVATKKLPEKKQGGIPVGAVGVLRSAARNGDEQLFQVEFRSPLLDYLFLRSKKEGSSTPYRVITGLKLFDDYGTFMLRPVEYDDASALSLQKDDATWEQLSRFSVAYPPDVLQAERRAPQNLATRNLVDSLVSAKTSAASAQQKSPAGNTARRSSRSPAVTRTTPAPTAAAAKSSPSFVPAARSKQLPRERDVAVAPPQAHLRSQHRIVPAEYVAEALVRTTFAEPEQSALINGWKANYEQLLDDLALTRAFRMRKAANAARTKEEQKAELQDAAGEGRGPAGDDAGADDDGAGPGDQGDGGSGRAKGTPRAKAKASGTPKEKGKPPSTPKNSPMAKPAGRSRSRSRSVSIPGDMPEIQLEPSAWLPGTELASASVVAKSVARAALAEVAKKAGARPGRNSVEDDSAAEPPISPSAKPRAGGGRKRKNSEDSDSLSAATSGGSTGRNDSPAPGAVVIAQTIRTTSTPAAHTKPKSGARGGGRPVGEQQQLAGGRSGVSSLLSQALHGLSVEQPPPAAVAAASGSQAVPVRRMTRKTSSVEIDDPTSGRSASAAAAAASSFSTGLAMNVFGPDAVRLREKGLAPTRESAADQRVVAMAAEKAHRLLQGLQSQPMMQQQGQTSPVADLFKAAAEKSPSSNAAGGAVSSSALASTPEPESRTAKKQRGRALSEEDATSESSSSAAKRGRLVTAAPSGNRNGEGGRSSGDEGLASDVPPVADQPQVASRQLQLGRNLVLQPSSQQESSEREESRRREIARLERALAEQRRLLDEETGVPSGSTSSRRGAKQNQRRGGGGRSGSPAVFASGGSGRGGHAAASAPSTTTASSSRGRGGRPSSLALVTAAEADQDPEAAGDAPGAADVGTVTVNSTPAGSVEDEDGDDMEEVRFSPVSCRSVLSEHPSQEQESLTQHAPLDSRVANVTMFQPGVFPGEDPGAC